MDFEFALYEYMKRIFLPDILAQANRAGRSCVFIARGLFLDPPKSHPVREFGCGPSWRQPAKRVPHEERGKNSFRRKAFGGRSPSDLARDPCDG